ncbi:nucleotidyltransferase family protein [Aeromonas caviae]|uniref:nucleotidyltransferase family protein n=1 Tax=Aeromonas caviae TaxID=648 RepID=UPI0029DB30D2|nr:nucleotidyltransferase family protein [Aeromonas caviae]MDX7844934.1 nucleotidyltransferase family protein [Aeromonas caviae]
MKRWQDALIKSTASIEQAIFVIDKSGLKLALVVDEELRLQGTVSDGDVRRGLLRHLTLQAPVTEIMQREPITCRVGGLRHEVLLKMQLRGVEQIPILDTTGRVIGLQTLQDLNQPQRLENSVILMAGGAGSRLAPLTATCPKPMLKVGTKPLLETIIESFVEHGFQNFYLSVNYLADIVKEYFEDGRKWGVNIFYLEETQPLGTAGSLGLIPKEKLTLPAIVMNGDILTRVNFSALLKFHQQHRAAATMCVREWQYQVPYGVVNSDGHRMVGITEKPIEHHFVNAGIYVLDQAAFELIQPGCYLDMPTLFNKLIELQQETSLFPVREYWLDIGQHHDFERANKDIYEVGF